MSKPTMVRMDEKTREKGEEQASKLGLNLSEYIRLIIHLDSSTEIISRLRGNGETNFTTKPEEKRR